MTNRQIFALAGTVVALIIGVSLFFNCFNKNEAYNWQIVQSPGGELTVRDEAGWYWSGFATVTTYPRVVQADFGDTHHSEDGQHFDIIRVTFNDGGKADLSGSLRYATPATVDDRIAFHREFLGNVNNATAAIMPHLINCVKATGPLMSASENQSARKAEFTSVVTDQLVDGLFSYNRVERELLDQFDEEGTPITVWATEIIRDGDGNPVIEQASPVSNYGIVLRQFSIGSTEYDDRTKELFAAKKESFLLAEQSKAEREREVQNRLMIVERGLREKAEVEAAANKEKARMTIEGETRVAVAQQAALQAEQLKVQQTTEAEARRDVAALDLEAERLNAQAVEVSAAAEEKRIEQAGAITEQERVLAEINAEMNIGIARELAQVRVPSTMIMGGGSEGGDSTLGNLLNVFLMRQMGVINDNTFNARSANAGFTRENDN